MITVGEAETSAFSSIEELLIARVPGIRRAPEGNGIIIRGAQSVTGNRDPLYVIDGVPSNSGAGNVSLYDVRDIEVVTSASSTATFGMRGVNGVILIRTKSSGQ